MRWPQSLFSSRRPILFGLDISSVSVKLLELSRIDGQYCVQTFGQQKLPDHLIVGNVVQDIPGLAQIVQELLVNLDLWTRSKGVLQAVIAVPDACTIHKNIQVSERLTDSDLDELVSLELAKCIPDSLEDVYFDFKHLDSSSQPGIKNLLIIAARAQYVKDRLAALRQIGLPATVVDVESLAMQRVLPFLLPNPPHSGITAILELGPRFLKVFFFKQAILLWMHEEEFDVLHLPVPCQDTAYQEGILQRFKRACHFLYAEYPHIAALDHIIVGGEGAQRSHVLSWLQQQCDRPVYSANPFVHMRAAAGCDLQQLHYDAPLYLTACGLAKRVC
ncbi:MAG: hypothetical protein EBY22_00390 [Gammaproteobacteria bacterium]|nr:hypothetical protein [Gammaproteobacteria bacterium]